MTMSTHDQIANKLAAKFHTDYKSDKGIDLVTGTRVIEVETKKAGIDQGIKQVAHSQKARYLAVTDLIKKETLQKTQNTGIGVMNESGEIIKKATR